MQAKRIRESAVTLAQVMNPQDANPAGNVHGGVIMKLIDTAAGAAAIKHAGLNCVTASIDRLDFHNPVFIGDLVTLRASINYTGKSSMEAGVRVAHRIKGHFGDDADAQPEFDVGLDHVGIHCG